MRPKIIEPDLSYRIGGCFYEVYNELKYGFGESTYSRAMIVSLRRHGLRVEREVPVTVLFQGVEVGTHRIDLVVENRVVIEIKATERLAEAAFQQTRSYVAALKVELGLLLHFGPKPRIERIVMSRNFSPSLPDSPNSPDL